MTAFSTVCKANDKCSTSEIKLDTAFVTVRVNTTYIKEYKTKDISSTHRKRFHIPNYFVFLRNILHNPN